MQRSSLFIKILFLCALSAGNDSNAMTFNDFIASYLPTGHEALKTLVTTTVPLVAVAAIRCCCCIIPARRRMRRAINDFNPQDLIFSIKTILKKRVEQECKKKNLFKDLDEPTPVGAPSCDGLFVIGSGEAIGTFFSELTTSTSSREIEFLRRSRGVILICGDFAPSHNKLYPHTSSISKIDIKKATDVFIAHQIPFLIIHIQEHLNNSAAGGMIGAPSFILHATSIPHIALPHLEQVPRVIGGEALYVSSIARTIRPQLNVHASAFALRRDTYPDARSASNFIDIFLKYLYVDTPDDESDEEDAEDAKSE